MDENVIVCSFNYSIEEHNDSYDKVDIEVSISTPYDETKRSTSVVVRKQLVNDTLMRRIVGRLNAICQMIHGEEDLLSSYVQVYLKGNDEFLEYEFERHFDELGVEYPPQIRDTLFYIFKVAVMEIIMIEMDMVFMKRLLSNPRVVRRLGNVLGSKNEKEA